MKILIFAVLAMVVSLSGALAQETPLRVNDTVALKIAGVPVDEQSEINSAYPVGDNGNIRLPYVGEVKAAGLTPSTLSRNIEAAYKAAEIYTMPSITIIPPEGPSSRRISVIGEVKVPQMVIYQDSMTLMEAISSCQGFTDFADQKAIVVMRGDQSALYDFRRLSEDPTKDPALQPGDRIIVRR
jgi:protein involved in polysaccharide export with SLBB domain